MIRENSIISKRVKYSIIASVFFGNLALCFVLPKITPIYFATNDDCRIRVIVNGLYTGTPNGNAVFMNYLLTSFLAFLYRPFPGVEWYGGFFYFSIFFANSIIESLFLTKSVHLKDLIFRGMIVLFYTAVTVVNHMLLQFTVTAGYWAALALTMAVSFIHSIEKNGSTRKNVFFAVMALFASWMSIMCRLRVFLLAFPLLGGYLVTSLIRSSVKRILRCVLPVSMVLLALLVNIGIDISQKFDENQYFLEFKSARSLIYDYTGYADYEENREFYDSIGLSKEAYDCLDGRLYDINEELTAERINLVAEYTEKLNRKNLPGRLWTSLAGVWDGIFQQQVNHEIVLFLLITALLLLQPFTVYSKERKLLVCLVFMYCFGCLAFLLFRGRLVPRVTQSVELLAIAAVFLVHEETEPALLSDKPAGYAEAKSGIVNAIRAALVVLTCVSVFASAYLFWTDSDGRRKTLMEQAELHYAMEEYMADHPDGFLFYNSREFGGYSDNVFENRHLGKPLRIDSLGNWTVFSDVYYERNEQFGFHSALEAFLEKDEFYYAQLSTGKPRIKGTLENLGKKLKKTDVIEVGDYKINIYRCIDMEK